MQQFALRKIDCLLLQLCPAFSSWSSWGDCSATCGRGTRTKSRSCLNGEVGQVGCIGTLVYEGVCVSGVSTFQFYDFFGVCSCLKSGAILMQVGLTKS